jgi:PD-(D/E)XK nuclease superfamily
MITIDPPARLPIDHLSVSSLKLFMACPEKFRRRYIEREYEPPSGKMILGSAAGAAEAQHYSTVIETGEGFTTDQVVDEFSDEWDDRIAREDIQWGADNPGELKDSGVAALERYHQDVAPEIVPVSVEREFRIGWDGVDWDLIGFMDLEEAGGAVSDLKMRGRKLSREDAAVDPQPTTYLYARRAEGNPASRFDFHTMVRAKKPYAEVVPTVRTDRQLDLFADRVFQIANEMAWRAETDNWAGAVPGSWQCSQRFCGYWNSCPMGGLR